MSLTRESAHLLFVAVGGPVLTFEQTVLGFMHKTFSFVVYVQWTCGFGSLRRIEKLHYFQHHELHIF
jgi:hypothetical protein